MASNTATNLAALGHQGARAVEVLYSTARHPVISLNFAQRYERRMGEPSVYQPIMGAAIAAASYSEGAAAVTPTAITTPTGVTLTPARYKVAVGVTNAGRWRALEVNDPKQLLESEARYAVTTYLGKDTTVGMTKLYESVTATQGDASTELSVQTCIDAAEEVREAANAGDAHVFIVINRRGANQVAKDRRNSSSAYLGNDAMTEQVRAMLSEAGIDPDENGYWTSLDKYTHIFVEPDYDALQISAGAYVGCAFIPAAAALQGYANPSEQHRKLIPAFGIAYDPDPVPAARETFLEGQFADIRGPWGVVTGATRAFTGGDDYVRDFIGSGTVSLMRDDHACQVLYPSS